MKTIDPSNSTFEKLITSNNVYVDKTKYFYKLLSSNNTYYFLSRPRRFGKSLTLSTLEAIFRAKRELFKGLYIDSTDYDWKEYPVIHIDFSCIAYINTENLRRQIKNALFKIAEQYNLEIPKDYEYNEILGKLIEQLAAKDKVVILIDEYDNPLSGNVNNPNIEEIRAVLRGFYSVLKAASDNIRFCFITGITKFSKMSIFSAMNNLTEISLDEEYATMFGYTQQELEDNFAEYIEKGMKTRGETKETYLALIKKWYNGYRFSPKGETVYNPVSIGSFFREGGEAFRNYWINTGGSLLLTEIAKRVHFDISTDTEITVPQDTLQAVDIIQMTKTEVNKDNFLSLLYQSGYLTIKNARLLGESYLYTLGYPDEEVRKGLTKILLPLYLGRAAGDYSGIRVLSMFYDGLIDKAINTIKAVFASIPYNEIVFNAENAWHASFLSMLHLMGANIIGEVTTNIGRIDAVLTTSDDIYIIEFKFNQSADKAIEQIKENKYYEPYLDSNKKIHLLGINFSTQDKNIVDWKCEDFEI